MCFSSEPHQYSKKNGEYISYFSDDFTATDTFRFEYKESIISFVPRSLYLKSDSLKSNEKTTQTSTPTIRSDLLKYASLFGDNTEYRLTDTGNIIKEELVLSVNPFPYASYSDELIFEHVFNYNGLIPYINGIAWDGKTTIITSNKIDFKINNAIHYSFAVPYVYDTKGTKTYFSIYCS